MSTITDEQFEWIEANRLPRDRWLGDSNAKPMIDELMDLGVMQPASGEFGPLRNTGKTMHLFGTDVPIAQMTSLYMLTHFGRAVLAKRAEAVPS